MPNRYGRDTAVLAKIETTYGVDSVPTGAADSMLVSNVKVQPIVSQNVDRDLLRSYFGASEQLLGTRYKMASFDVEAVGSGTAGTAPAWGPLMRACGWSQTLTATTRVDYLPVTNNQESCSIWVYDSGTLHKMVGCRGKLVPNFKMGEVPKWKFDFMGLDVTGADSAGTPSGVGYAAFMTPQVVTDQFTGDITLGCTHLATGAPTLTAGVAYPSTGLELDIGLEVNHQPLLGGESIEITGRSASGKMQLDLSSAQEVTMLDDVRNATLTSLGFVHGTVTGRRVLLFAPSVQRTNPTKEDLNGKRLIGFDLRLLPGAAGNDELRIVTSF